MKGSRALGEKPAPAVGAAQSKLAGPSHQLGAAPRDDVGIAADQQLAVPVDRVDRTRLDRFAVGPVQVRYHRHLVRDRHVGSDHVVGPERGHGGGQVLGRDLSDLVRPVQPSGLEGGLLNGGTGRIGDAVAQQEQPAVLHLFLRQVPGRIAAAAAGARRMSWHSA